MYKISYIWKFFERNNIYVRYKRKKEIKFFLSLPVSYENIFDIGKTDKLVIYSIAYNHIRPIKYQYELLKKNIKDPFFYVVVDNSTDMESSLKIRNFCQNKEISYIKLPKNNLFSSRSHSVCLNYIMKNYVLNRKINSKYIGFLDHDCFPIKNIKIVPILIKQKMFGRLIDENLIQITKSLCINLMGGRWFLWPGCAFYDVDVFISGYDFLPKKYFFPLSFLDSGGGNREYIYKKIDKNKLFLLDRRFDNGNEYIGEYFFHVGGVVIGSDTGEEKRIENGYKKMDQILN